MLRVALVLLLVTGAAHANVVRVGDRAVELDTAVDASNKPFKLAAYRGRWVVLAIGAAWCDPCKAELPVLDRLTTRFAAVFITLAIDDEIPAGKAFHDRLKLTRLVRAYMPEERSAIAGRYGANKMPSTFVIDPTGIVRLVHDGFDHRALAASTKKLHDALASVLPPKPTPAKPTPPRPTPPAKPKPPANPPPKPRPDPRITQPAPDTIPRPPAAPVREGRQVSTIVLPEPPRSTWWSPAWKLAPF